MNVSSFPKNTQTFLVISLLILTLVLWVSRSLTTVYLPPWEGDSRYYHLPIAQSLLDGSFLHPAYGSNAHMYFPAANETILSLFLLAGIPLGFYNTLSVILLAMACYLLARRSTLNQLQALVFSIAIISLQVVYRWAGTQIVDLWLAAFYTLALALLLRPQQKLWYWTLLGVTLGFVLGGKYSGPLFIMILIVLCFKPLRPPQRLLHLITFLTPVTLLGFFWYFRNWLVKGNPFFPLHTPLFPGVIDNPIIHVQVWHTFLASPLSMFNAFVSEYMVWSLLALIPIAYLIHHYLTHRSKHQLVHRLCLLGLANLLIFLLLPSGNSYQLHVSQFRFSLPVFIPLILATFLLAKKFSVINPLYFLVLANLSLHFLPAYRPKLILIFSFFYFFLLIGKKQVFHYLQRKFPTAPIKAG